MTNGLVSAYQPSRGVLLVDTNLLPNGYSLSQEMRESIDKPGSVVDSHSSGICVTTYLKQPTRERYGSHHHSPIWPCSERGLPCHRVLPPARCALTAPFHPYHHSPRTEWRFIFCCTFRGLTPPRRYLALYPVEPGLSSPHT